jgi:hypothetical protein
MEMKVPKSLADIPLVGSVSLNKMKKKKRGKKGEERKGKKKGRKREEGMVCLSVHHFGSPDLPADLRSVRHRLSKIKKRASSMMTMHHARQ